MVTRLSLMLFVGMLVSGCGIHSPLDSLFRPIKKYSKPNVPYDDVFNDSAYNCDGMDCSKSVGLVVLKASGVEFGQCTGTLVAPDIVMTNSHCIPPKVLDDPKNCSSNLGIVLRGAKTFERYHCSELLSHTKKPTENMALDDFAFFRLEKPTTLPFLKMGSDGMKDSGNYHIFAIDPIINETSQGLFGTMRKKIGHSYQLTMLTPTFDNNLSSGFNLFLSNRPLISGNSGSAVLDENGNIQALIQYSFARQEDAKKFQIHPGFSGGTNLACKNIPEIKKVANSNCSTRQVDSYVTVTENDAFTMLQKFFKRLERSNSVRFEASYHLDTTSTTSDYPPKYPVRVRSDKFCYYLMANELAKNQNFIIPNGSGTLTLDEFWRPLIDNQALKLAQVKLDTGKNTTLVAEGYGTTLPVCTAGESSISLIAE